MKLVRAAAPRIGEFGLSITKYIGSRLRELREAKGDSPEKVASFLSISLERYVAFELGRVRISARHLYDLSYYFGVTVTHFIDGYEDPARRNERATKLPKKKNGSKSPKD